MSTVFIAGPMTGLPEYNYPLFHRVGERLEEYGFDVRSGAHDYCTGGRKHKRTPPDPKNADDHGYYLRESLRELLLSDVYLTLPGWEDSKGAQMEVQVAKAIGMPNLTLDIPGLLY